MNTKKIDIDDVILINKNNFIYVTINKTDPNIFTIDMIVKRWVKKNNIPSNINKLNLKQFIKDICLENILWVSSDLNKEVEKIYNNIIITKESTYHTDYIVDQIIKYYNRIYKKRK